MEDPSIVITGVGMVTSVGLGAIETAANIRASTGRASLTPLLDCHFESVALASVLVESLPHLPENAPRRIFRTAREERMLALAGLALADLKKSAHTGSPPLLLALPEHETNNPISAEGFLDDLHALHPDAFSRATSKATWRGRSGGLQALAVAKEMLQSGISESVLVGGVDSFVSSWILAILEKSGRTKSEVNHDGFIPGEGAGFLLVSTITQAQKAKKSILAHLEGPGCGREAGHWASAELYQGEGLCEAVGMLLNQSEPAPFAEVYSTMNGESYWTKEWGMVRVRHSHAFAERARLHHPFEFTGDLGAAAGPVLTGLAVVGLNTKYRQSPIMIYASNDFCPRAAIVISIPH